MSAIHNGVRRRQTGSTGMTEHTRENGQQTADRPLVHQTSPQTPATRWDPVDIFETLQDEMDRFWRRPGPQLPTAPRIRFRGQGGSRTNWAPRIDVFGKDNSLIVRADVPGMKKDDVQIEVADGALVLRGESTG